jgi:hypothetical protein
MRRARLRFETAKVVVALGGLAGVATRWLIWAYRFDHERYATSLEEGRAIVRAVYAYKEKTGGWPQELKDLEPDFLPSIPERWTYGSPGGAVPPRLAKLCNFHTCLYYYFPPATHPAFPPGVNAGWICDNEGQESYQPDPP